MKIRISSILAILAAWPTLSHAADFDLGLGYAQSRDFWETVHDVQDKTGNLTEIQRTLNDRYGRPDILYSYLDASYSYPHSWFESNTLSHAFIGTRAEALAGGQVSNPIFPEIQAYANSTGIASYGFRSRSDALARGFSFWSWRLLAGMGPERRLYAKGPEFIEAIPVRSGTLLLAGTELAFLDQSEFDGDFWVTSNIFVRPVYFRSSVPAAKSFPDEERSFWTWRWRIQNEWLKQTDSFLSTRTRFGIISVAGQNPVPFTSLPITWDYQQKTQLYQGIGASSGIGGILRVLTESSLPNLALYGGLFGGAFGAGIDLQLGPVILNGSTYALENSLTTTHDRTRMWQAQLGLAL